MACDEVPAKGRWLGDEMDDVIGRVVLRDALGGGRRAQAGADEDEDGAGHLGRGDALVEELVGDDQVEDE